MGGDVCVHISATIFYADDLTAGLYAREWQIAKYHILINFLSVGCSSSQQSKQIFYKIAPQQSNLNK